MISSIGSFNPASFSAASGLNRSNTSGSDASQTSSAPSAKDVFLDYMKKSPAERMEDAWLKSHGLDEQKLAAMSPEDREKVMKQMKEEIEQSLKQKAQTGSTVDLQA